MWIKRRTSYVQVAVNYKLKFNHSPQLSTTLLHRPRFHAGDECLCVFRGFMRELGQCGVGVGTNLCLPT